MIHCAKVYYAERGASVEGKDLSSRVATLEGCLLTGFLTEHHRRLTHRQLIYLRARTTRHRLPPSSSGLPVGCLPIVFSVELPEIPLCA